MIRKNLAHRTPVTQLIFNSDHENTKTILQNFRELENFSSDRLLSQEEKFCEIHFQKTHKRNKTKIFIVEMPIKIGQFDSFGDSKRLSQKRLRPTIKKIRKQFRYE